jgi:hypothetical protein
MILLDRAVRRAPIATVGVAVVALLVEADDAITTYWTGAVVAAKGLTAPRIDVVLVEYVAATQTARSTDAAGGII